MWCVYVSVCDVCECVCVWHRSVFGGECVCTCGVGGCSESSQGQLQMPSPLRPPPRPGSQGSLLSGPSCLIPGLSPPAPVWPFLLSPCLFSPLLASSRSLIHTPRLGLPPSPLPPALTLPKVSSIITGLNAHWILCGLKWHQTSLSSGARLLHDGRHPLLVPQP